MLLTPYIDIKSMSELKITANDCKTGKHCAHSQMSEDVLYTWCSKNIFLSCIDTQYLQGQRKYVVQK